MATREPAKPRDGQVSAAPNLAAVPDAALAGPATRLLGRRLENGWTVVERFDRATCGTGGLCSVGYRVESDDGRQAFMKAHDYARAIHQHVANFSRVLEDMLAAYNLEKDLNEQCAGARLSRVVRSLDAGAVLVEGSELPVNYIVFELADGDIRHRLDGPDAAEFVWKLEALHQVAVGLAQLHRHGIVHQDVKPSNVMTFEDEGSKVGDLGSAWKRGAISPLQEAGFGGDPDYAPPECLFDFELPEVLDRLKARDLYRFGSLILFVFTGVDATTALLTKLPAPHHPGRSAAGFGEALPHLREAHDKVVEEFASTIREHDAERLAELFAHLCEPDPRRRGHPSARTAHSDPLSLERFITALDRLRREAVNQPSSSVP